MSTADAGAGPGVSRRTKDGGYFRCWVDEVFTGAYAGVITARVEGTCSSGGVLMKVT